MLNVIKRLWRSHLEAATSVPMLFIGGPMDGELEDCPVTQRHFIVEGVGRYSVAYFGFDDHVLQRVFVWDAIHFTEALEKVIDCYSEFAGERPF